MRVRQQIKTRFKELFDDRVKEEQEAIVKALKNRILELENASENSENKKAQIQSLNPKRSKGKGDNKKES